ncbi:MAG: AAA family ATPase [Hydrogenophaga sp.]|nr:AAA family ATPase [Hydrogenophaga sp.]
MNPCVFLLGLHGVGKTTVGRKLQSEHNWMHISLGDLGRLARARRLPREHSVRFMGYLASQQPGERLNRSLIDSLLLEVENHRSHRLVSVDGFPAEPYHVGLLPPNSLLVHLTAPESTRTERLTKRGEATVRQWSNKSAGSQRDRDLPAILEHHREKILELDATEPVDTVVRRILALLYRQTT